MMFSSSAFLVVLMLVSDGKCNGDVEPEMAGVPEPPAGVPEDTSPPPPPSNNGGAESVTGLWYAVMATATGDGGPCNLFTNNKEPCRCISAYFRPLQDGWEVFINVINNQTSKLTVDEGGASGQKEMKCFTKSRAEMPLSAVAASKYTITEKVSGTPLFMKYGFNVIGYSEEFFYMITQLQIDNGPQPFTVIWCRKRFPGKKTIWTKIVQNLKQLGINAHDLSFIKQDGCVDLSTNQYDNMFFCSQ